MTRETQLSETFVELADTLVNHFDVADLLHTLATRSVDLFDLDAAGLVIADHVGNLRVVGSSIARCWSRRVRTVGRDRARSGVGVRERVARPGPGRKGRAG